MVQFPDGLPLPWLSVPLILACLAAHSAEAQLIVAHRGASHDAPENTLAAFELAWEQGADAVEGDFYLSQDGHIVTLHDSTTQRTAGIDLKVADATLERLGLLDVGAWKSPQYRGERIPTLPQVLAAIPPGKKIFIEIKCGPELVVPLKRVLAAAKLAAKQTVVISFNKDVIATTKRLMPHVQAYWLTSFKQDEQTGQWSPALPDVLKTLEDIRADGLDAQANRQVIDDDFVTALRDRGLGFHVWTVDDPAVARYFQRLGVDSITTNRPGFLREEL